MTWLITVARHKAISRIRKRKTPTIIIDSEHDVADTSPTPEMLAVQKSERAQIERCLLKLDPANANAGVYFEGRAYQDLADCAGVPINTMRTRLRRSLLKLRVCLSK